MNLNIVDILIITVVGLSIISGMYKGFIASGLAAVGFVASWFGAMRLYPQLANSILSNRSLIEMFKYYMNVDTLMGSRSVSETLVSNAVSDGYVLENALKMITNVPKVIQDAFQTNVTNQMFAVTVDQYGSSTPWLRTLGEYLSQTLLTVAVNVLAFLILFAVAYLIVLLVVNLLNNVFHFPLLRHMDWLLGGVFGAARGYVVMALILVVVPMVLSILNLEAINNLLADSVLMQHFRFDFVINDIIKAAFPVLS